MLVFIVSAVLLYLNGCGNPDIGMMVRQDAKMKWYLQRAGNVYLQQAYRQKQRAAMLEQYSSDRNHFFSEMLSSST